MHYHDVDPAKSKLRSNSQKKLLFILNYLSLMKVTLSQKEFRTPD
ncbi:MAG: hypothetical protein RMY34_36675 [Aulosira sp. DedQUE10]|nr:hypothetical protein [Aulosira sp. DedQUE10]